MCFKADLPLILAQLDEPERSTRATIGSDQCILDNEHFSILGNLDLPMTGSEEVMRWTVWTTLSQANFERTSELWETAGREKEPPYFGWLSNPIPGYPQSMHLKTLVHTQPVGIKPQIEVIEEGHVLTIDQQRGISPERVDTLIHAAMHR